MPDYKVTLLFAAGKNGFSESWYTNTDSIAGAMIRAGGLAAARATLMGLGTEIEGWRITDANTPGTHRLVLQTVPPDLAGQPPPLERDQASAALLCRMDGEYARRQFWMRGLPDAWIVWNPTVAAFYPTPAARGRFTAFVSYLNGNGWCIRAYDKRDGPNPAFRILGLSTNIAGQFSIQTVGFVGVNGEKVVIRGVRGENVKQVRGVFQVFNATGNSFDIPVIAPASYLYKGGGTVRRQVYTLFPIQLSSQIIAAATRRVGRRFFVRPGRSRPRR